jgi:hypothetical protein
MTMNGTADDNTVEAFQDKKTSNIYRIKHLLEEGKSTDDIAAELHTTVPSLRAFCSRNGISMREIRAGLTDEASAPVTPKEGNVVSVLPLENSRRGRRKENNDTFSVSLRINYKGKSTNMDLPLPIDKVALLYLDAGLRSVPVGEVLAKLMAKTMEGMD